MKRHTSVLAGLVAGACLAACGTPREPVRQIGHAEVAVQSAREEHAGETAGADLAMASDKLDRAKAALRQKQYDRAERLAEEASADAELARVKAESDSAQKDAKKLQTTTRELRDEAERGASMPQ